MTLRVLCIDNYDSFVYTIISYLRQLGVEVQVVRNDAIPGWVALNSTGLSSSAEVKESNRQVVAEAIGNYDGVLISPGPGNPSSAGASLDAITGCAELGVPLLGVCLGHQALAQVFGAKVVHAPTLMHGRTSAITHCASGLFTGLASPVDVTRYHSLTVDPETIPAELNVTAETADGVIMGLSHRTLPLHGVQFHPESVLTEGGYSMLAQWLVILGDTQAPERAKDLVPLLNAASS